MLLILRLVTIQCALEFGRAFSCPISLAEVAFRQHSLKLFPLTLS